MLVKNAENRWQLEFVSLENMVPQEHLLRKIDAAIDFKKIYEFVEELRRSAMAGRFFMNKEKRECR